MATSLEISKKQVQIGHLRPKMLSFDVKIAKIGPADLQIICLREIIKKKRQKLRSVKHIALSATFAERAKKVLIIYFLESVQFHPKHQIVTFCEPSRQLSLQRFKKYAVGCHIFMNNTRPCPIYPSNQYGSKIL